MFQWDLSCESAERKWNTTRCDEPGRNQEPTCSSPRAEAASRFQCRHSLENLRVYLLWLKHFVLLRAWTSVQNVVVQESVEIPTEKPPWKISGKRFTVCLASLLACSQHLRGLHVITDVLHLMPISKYDHCLCITCINARCAVFFPTSPTSGNIWDCWRRRKTTNSAQSELNDVLRRMFYVWIGLLMSHMVEE